MLTRPSLLHQRSILPLFFRSYKTVSKMPPKSSTAAALDFLDFVNASPTPFHVVSSAIQRLHAAGFTELKERDPWNHTLRPGGKYYLTRNGSSIIAFAVGAKWKAGNPIAMVGAHTDSCALKIKPVSRKSGSGFLQLGVEAYGGGIWHTWFDRDLSIAGRVMVRDGKGGFVQRLVKVERPILRVPTLAIHLHRQTNFDPNKETELFPIAGLVAAELNRTREKSGQAIDEDISELEIEKKGEFAPLKAMTERHHPYIVEIIAEHAGVKVDDVVDFEMQLYDVQPGCIGGLNNELLFASRLDNQGMTYCAVRGLIDSVSSSSALDDDSTIRLIACFDHEEVGSSSAQGAHSNFLPAVIKRLSTFPGQSELSEASYDGVKEADGDISTAYEQTLATSFLVSADMAHSINPNYVGKYESDHHPLMNAGPVIKINSNQKYATNSPGIVLLQEAARRAKPSPDDDDQSKKSTAAGVPLQLFVIRNDSLCGSTIGPILATALGTRTVDVGNAQLSMHSIRETGGVEDVQHGVRLFESFFEHFADLESKIVVD